MVLVPYDRLEDSDDIAPDVIRPYVGAVCALRRLTPELFRPALTSIPQYPPTYLPGMDSFWDDICDDGLADPALPIGGQCPVVYDPVFVNNDGVEEPWFTFPDTSGELGPVRRIVRELDIEDPLNPGQFRVLAYTITDDRGSPRTYLAPGNPFGAYIYPGSAYMFLRRRDGLPDDCGSRPPDISPDPPIIPPTVPIIVGGQAINVPVNLPNIDLGNWPNFQPDFTFEFPDITLEFTPEGINIPDFDFPEFPQLPPPNVTVPPGGDTQVQIEAAINNAISSTETVIVNEIGGQTVKLDCIEDLIKTCCGEFDTYGIQPIVTGTLGGTFDLPARTVGIRISGSAVDVNRIRTQAGSGGAPTVFYWGWYSVSAQPGEPGDRVNLAYNPHIAIAPPHARSVTVNPIFGARATIEAIIIDRPPLPNCGE